jgi:hypothetical protein
MTGNAARLRVADCLAALQRCRAGPYGTYHSPTPAAGGRLEPASGLSGPGGTPSGP